MVIVVIVVAVVVEGGGIDEAVDGAVALEEATVSGRDRSLHRKQNRIQEINGAAFGCGRPFHRYPRCRTALSPLRVHRVTKWVNE